MKTPFASTNSIKTAHSPSTFNLKQINLSKIMQSILLLDPSPELQVWQAFDQQGNRVWNAHDPLRQRSIQHISEAEMRIWLEQRYRC